MPHAVDEQRVAPGQDAGVGLTGHGKRRRWHYWVLLPVLALMVAACVAGLALGIAVARLTAPPPAAGSVTSAGGAGLVRVLSSTGQVLGGPSFPEVNGIADGLGGLWLTGGDAGQNHVLYGVGPAMSRIDVRVDLPSRLVINPNDVAVGAGAVWAAVGASVYRIEPASAGKDGVAARPFVTLPGGALIGDLAVHAGALWVTDTTRGRVYRFAASTGRLEAAVPVGATAGAMAVGDGGVWVADEDNRTISRISVAHSRVGPVLTVPGVPSHIAVSAGGLWVTDGARGVVRFLDSASGRVFTVPVGREPSGVAASGDTVWVANTADGTLSRIDARRHVVEATVSVGLRPYALAADRRGVWVALLGRAVMVHTPSVRSPSRAAGLLSWVERLCGG